MTTKWAEWISERPAALQLPVSHAFLEVGGAVGDRTPDLRNAIATLSQLSYGPKPFHPPGLGAGGERAL